MSNRIQEMSCTAYRKRLASDPLVIIPTGACEAYGPHLPMGTDYLAAQAVSERVAEQTGALIAPSVEIGESSALISYFQTFTLSRHLLEQFLDELVGKLMSDGVRKLLFITGHAGNVDSVSYIVKKYLHTGEIRAAQIDWWRFAAFHGHGIFDTDDYHAHGHAAEAGTSLMLYLHPELVDVSALPCTEPRQLPDYPDILQYQTLKERTDNAMVGDARNACAEKGQQILDRAVQRIIAYLKERSMI